MQYKYLRALEFETVLLRHYIDLPANFPPQLVRDNMAAPTEEYITVRSNESYGVKFDVQRNEGYRTDVAVDECYDECGINQSNAANFDVQKNECYGVALNSFPNSTSNGQPKCDDLGKNSGKTGKAVAVLFALLLTLLLGMVAACVVFALEISDLKSEIASLNHQNYTALDKELTTGLAGQHASFPLDSCAALPPSSPSGHYWVRTPTGSAVLVYCDPTRSCGGVTGGWRRVAELDMTNSSQQCPSALRQRNESNIHTCRTDPNVLCTSITFPVNFLSYSGVCGKISGWIYR